MSYQPVIYVQEYLQIQTKHIVKTVGVMENAMNKINRYTHALKSRHDNNTQSPRIDELHGEIPNSVLHQVITDVQYYRRSSWYPIPSMLRNLGLI